MGLYDKPCLRVAKEETSDINKNIKENLTCKCLYYCFSNRK